MSCQVCHSFVCRCDNTLTMKLSDRIAALEKQNAELLAALGAKQAEIDRLMLEYCPNEMSLEQLAEWARHQKKPALEVVCE